MPLVLSAVFGCSLQWKNCPFAGFISFTWGFSICEITKWYITYVLDNTTYYSGSVIFHLHSSPWFCRARMHDCTTVSSREHLYLLPRLALLSNEISGVGIQSLYPILYGMYMFICICMYMLRIRGSSEVASCLFFIFHHLWSVFLCLTLPIGDGWQSWPAIGGIKDGHVHFHFTFTASRGHALQSCARFLIF